jgi:hypothetical protein
LQKQEGASQDGCENVGHGWLMLKAATLLD